MTTNLKPNPTINKVHANKFKLILPKISIIEDIFNLYAMNFLEISVRGTIAAGLSVAAIDTPTIGHKPYKLTGAGYEISEIPITFLIDGDFLNYYMLWSWLNKIYNLNTAVAPVLANDENPYEDFEIIGLDNYNNEVVKFKYRGGFITSISEVNVAYDNSDRLEANVSFAYDDYIIEVAKLPSS